MQHQPFVYVARTAHAANPYELILAAEVDSRNEPAVNGRAGGVETRVAAVNGKHAAHPVWVSGVNRAADGARVQCD